MKKHYLALLLLSALVVTSCDNANSFSSANSDSTHLETPSATPSETPSATPSETPSETPSDSTSEEPVVRTISIAEAIQLAASYPSGAVTDSDEVYRVQGVVSEIKVENKSFELSSGSDSIIVYGITAEDAPKTGLDFEVVIEGNVTRYYDTYEITSPTIVSYTPATYSIAIDENIQNGTIQATAVENIAWGTSVTLTVAPNEGYKLVSLLVNNVAVVVTENTYVVTVTKNLTVMATFASNDSKVATEIYTTGFESSEGFTTSTTYNNAEPANFGPADAAFAITMGCVSSSSGFISGAQSIQCRAYKGNSMYGVIESTFMFNHATSVSFDAKESTGNCKMSVSISTDQSSWTVLDTVTLATAATNYNFTISDSEDGLNVYIRISLSYDSVPTGTYKMFLDNFVVKGYK